MPLTFRELALPVVVGAPVAAASVTMAWLSLPAVGAGVMTVGLVGAHLALAVRRVTPMTSLVLVVAGFATQLWVSGLFLTLPSVVVFPVALYSVCAWGRRGAVAVAGTAGLLGAGVATWRLVVDHSVLAAGLRPEPLAVFGMLAATAVAAVALGLYRRTRLALRRAEAARAATEAADRARREVRADRQRIARELHDVVSHSLSVIVSQAKGGRYAGRTDPDTALAVLATVEDTGRRALTDMRGLLGVLRPDDDERDRAPLPGLAALPELIDRTGLPVRRDDSGEPGTLTPAAELAAYRLVQEGLTNVVRHAGPDPAAVVGFVWDDGRLTVTVSNRVTGTGSVPPGGGHGLAGLRERFAALGGTVDWTFDDEVFTLTGSLPCRTVVTP